MDEEIIKQKYIKISHSDFLRLPLVRSTNSYFRSLEAYLRKNNRAYNIDGQTCIIYVSDKNDAMSVGLHFNLRRLEYFDGLELLPLILTAKEKNRGRPKSMIFDSAGKPITMKKLREQSSEDVKIHCLERKEIIKRGILTKESLKSAIAKGALTPITIRSNVYINRQELANFIKSKTEHGRRNFI